MKDSRASLVAINSSFIENYLGTPRKKSHVGAIMVGTWCTCVRSNKTLSTIWISQKFEKFQQQNTRRAYIQTSGSVLSAVSAWRKTFERHLSSTRTVATKLNLRLTLPTLPRHFPGAFKINTILVRNEPKIEKDHDRVLWRLRAGECAVVSLVGLINLPFYSMRGSFFYYYFLCNWLNSAYHWFLLWNYIHVLAWSFQEYNACLSRIRSFLAASNRSRTTLQECERLLGQARQHATAMQGLAEVEGNPMKIREASQKIERDIAPLSREIARALGNEGGREELFYQAPAANARDYGYNSGDMESLMGSSEDMLRESLSWVLVLFIIFFVTRKNCSHLLSFDSVCFVPNLS